MSFTINIDSILFLLAVLGCVVLVFLIIVLKRLSTLMVTIEGEIHKNSNSISTSISKIPEIVNGANDIVYNTKDITNTARDAVNEVADMADKAKATVENAFAVASTAKDIVGKKSKRKSDK